KIQPLRSIKRYPTPCRISNVTSIRRSKNRVDRGVYFYPRLPTIVRSSGRQVPKACHNQEFVGRQTQTMVKTPQPMRHQTVRYTNTFGRLDLHQLSIANGRAALM